MKRKLIAAGLTLLMAVQGIAPLATAEAVSTPQSETTNTQAGVAAQNVTVKETGTAYADYVEKNGGVTYGDGTELVFAPNGGVFLNADNTGKNIAFTAEKAGWYAVRFDYRSRGEASNNHQIGVGIDGAFPYTAIALQEVPRIWLAGEISVLEDGTQVRGDVTADPDWAQYTLYDNTGMITDPYMIYLSAGNHVLNMVWHDGDMELRNITLFAFEGMMDYATYKEKYNNKVYGGDPLERIEAEDFVRANSLSVTAASDLSSSQTTPYSYEDQLLNVMGGSNWQYTGQRVEWNVTVPEAGLYHLTIRFKQSYKTNLKAYRKLMVNGEVPFKEAMSIPFNYDGNWQTLQPDWAVWLEKGENTLAMEVTPGDAAVLMNGLNETVQQLNTLYRRIIMLTGTSPDTYRDYHLDVEIPGVAESFLTIAEELGKLLKTAEELYDTASSFYVLRDTQRQLEDMAKNLRSVTKSGRLDRFKSNISSLGSLGQTLREQALQIDSLVLSSPEHPMEVKPETFWERAKHTWLRFIASFSDDYNASIGTKKDSITIWTSMGRDQLGILKSMTANEFVPKTGINAEVQLVTGSLIQAVLAGKGPDIVLRQGETDVINYAMRGALKNLKEFKDFDEVMSQFSPDATTPFTYEDGVYALPQTQSFSMMFVRDDILEELGLEIPKTWDDFVTKIFPVLQRDNLLVGVGNLSNGGALTGIFLTLLYQYGGTLYSEDLLSSALTTPQALEAFDFAVSLYSEYGVPTQYDFLNRFRTGEMPIAIADYSTYNQLQIGAPEIAGLWTMLPIPGVLQEDGTINNTQLMAFAGAIMLAGTKSEDACWEFMKWWGSADVQQSFGLQQEAILGPSGRYTPANLKALAGLSWSGRQLELLEEQRSVSTALMHVPGSYYIGKSINSATVTSVNDGTLIPREELMYWVELIDNEMQRKQKEFNFKGRVVAGEGAAK